MSAHTLAGLAVCTGWAAYAAAALAALRRYVRRSVEETTAR